MERIVITQFSDPMMGLSWECGPALRKVKERFGDALELREAMVVLVRDVADYMTPDERALPPDEGIARYNDRLAQIYLDEVPIGGVPMNMDGFALFAPDRRTSRPLCLAYEAAKAVDPVRAADFLFRLRRATVVERRQTTRPEVLAEIVREAGVDEGAFAQALADGSADAALAADVHLAAQVGVRSLPAFLVEGESGAMLLHGVPVRGELVKAVVDIQKKLVVVDAELHVDEEQLLLESGSAQGDLWGINLYPEDFGTEDFIEFDSMINIRPSQGNRSRSVEDESMREAIRRIIEEVVHE